MKNTFFYALSLLLILAIVYVCCGPIQAQTLTPALSESFSYPGSSISLTLVFADSTPSSQIISFGFQVNLPVGFILGTPVLGPATPPNVSAICNPANGICLLANTTNLPFVPYAGGLIVTIPITPGSSVAPGAYSVGMSNAQATNLALSSVSITYAGQTTASLPLAVKASTGTTAWFTESTGQTTCKVSKVAQIPFRISFTCSNPFGAVGGSYTAGPFPGVNSFIVSLNSLGADTVICTIVVNGTTAPAMGPMIRFDPFEQHTSLAPNSAGYSCNTNSFSGQGSIGWP